MPSITLCTITGNVENILGTNVSGVVLSASVLTPFIHPTNGSVIIGQIGQATTDASGNFMITCIETTTPGVGVRFTFSYYDGISATKQKYFSAVVPNQSAVTFQTLINSQTPPSSLQSFPASQVSLSPISGIVSTNVQAAVAELYSDITSSAGIQTLTGDVSATGTGSVVATVNSVGTSSATNVHLAEVAANAATNSNTNSTIVKRDASGNFSAGTITGSLTGNATGLSATLVVGSGGTGVTSVTTAPAASAWAGWDANKNFSANNLIDGATSTATAAGTTTLTVASTGIQVFTGVTTQTVKLPDVTTLVNGQQFLILNRSTGVVTVQSSGANSLQALVASTYLLCTILDTTAGTGTASWSWQYGMLQSAALAVLQGGTGTTAVRVIPAASAWAGWDASKNFTANNLVPLFTTTATAAGTTTLLVTSTATQYFTGVTTQTVALPVASTLANGLEFKIVNQSSGVVTVQTSGANSLQAMAQNTQLVARCVNTAGGTGLASWDWVYSAVQGGLGGSGTVTSVTFTGDGTVLSSTPSSAVTTTGTLTAALATQTARTFLSGPLSGSAATPTFKALSIPTVQTFTSGSGTYTTPTSPVPLYIKVRMVGGGGGGGGSSTQVAHDGANGTAGGNSTFGTTLLAANGGALGPGSVGNGINGGLGGTASLGSGPIGIAIQGGQGGPQQYLTITGVFALGGDGGVSTLGGAGGAGSAGTNGGAAIANSGSGGGGAGGPSGATGSIGGCGGGAGGSIEAIITAPTTTYAYAVGAAGAGGAAGTSGNAGGAGSAGYIQVTEYYQ